MKKLITLLSLAFVVLLVFWLGRQLGRKTTSEQLITNNLIIKEIAELASLEVDGVGSVKTSNLENDGTWTDNLKKFFIENTVWLSIPYAAKYGVSVDEKQLHIAVSDNRIIVRLPSPRLLSYEMKIDRMEASNRKGWLLMQNDETYIEVQKKLYQTSRLEMENNHAYLQQCREKIRKIITQYYQPLLQDYELDVQFEEDHT